MSALKLAVVAFVLLAGAALANIAFLQPNSGRGTIARAVVLGEEDTSRAAVRPSTAAAPSAGTVPRVTAAAPASKLDTTAAASAATLTSAQEVTRAVQRELKERGYETGAADGQAGLMTRAAIIAYEYDRDLPLTGEPTSELLKEILLESSPVVAVARQSAGREQSVQATQVIRTIQQSLATLGYAPGKVDGRLGDDTIRAIRQFETDQAMPETGRVSGQLVARLSRIAGQARPAQR